MISVTLILCFFGALAKAEETVDYFLDLINKEKENAYNHRLSQNALMYRTPPTKNYYGEYDYIIVGAGSSGSVIANRLSENEHQKILILEAGSLESNFTDIPAMRFAVQLSKYNWGHFSTPQKTACLGLLNQTCPIPRGRGVGGSTLINGLVYSRPNPHDFERWKTEGNPGWSYEEVLPYFIKSEKTNIPNADTNFHGKDGFLNVEYRSPQSPILQAFLEGNVELGRHIVDYNGKTQLGVSTTQHNTIFGVRDSNAKAFIKTALHRKNLRLLINAYVTKILIDEENCAKGIEFSYKHKRYYAFARKEIILSAGAVNSPQILQLSGVGPKNLLEKYHIPVKADLSGVGQNLHEHPTFHGLFFETTHSEGAKTLKDSIEEYLIGIGPLTMPGNNQAVGFFRTPLARFQNVPDLKMTLITPNSSDELTPKILNLQKDTTQALFGDSIPNRQISILVSILQPMSKGSVEIKSKNPLQYPRIDLNLLSNSYDIDSLFSAIEMVFEIINTQAFRDLDAKYSPRPLKGCRNHEFVSREYWYCALRQLTLGMGNLGGTCKMGAKTNESVVDNKFRVYGVRNLRVADASVIPFPLSGDYNAAATLIGERVADFIKENEIA